MHTSPNAYILFAVYTVTLDIRRFINEFRMDDAYE